jgi:hypothetical protein
MTVTIKDFEGKVIETMSTEEAVRRGYELSESIPTQDSLKTHKQAKRPSNDDVAKALGVLMHLSPDERQKHFSELGLQSHEGGDGVPDGTAEKSRKSLKDAQKSKSTPKLKKETVEAMKEAFPGTSDELLEQFAARFVEMAENVSIRNKLIEMITVDNPELRILLMSEEQLNAVDMLADRIEWLELQIEAVELDNARLRSQAAEREALAEEVLYDAPRSVNRRRSLGENFSSVNEDTLIIDENGKVTGSDTSFTSQNQHVSNPAMRTYVEALNRTTRNVDRHTAKEDLVEAWMVGS